MILHFMGHLPLPAQDYVAKGPSLVQSRVKSFASPRLAELNRLKF